MLKGLLRNNLADTLAKLGAVLSPDEIPYSLPQQKSFYILPGREASFESLPCQILSFSPEALILTCSICEIPRRRFLINLLIYSGLSKWRIFLVMPSSTISICRTFSPFSHLSCIRASPARQLWFLILDFWSRSWGVAYLSDLLGVSPAIALIHWRG